MADGSSVGATRPALPRLAEAEPAQPSLWARCGCGRAAAVDPRPWIAQGLAGQTIEALEDRLRCLCGARRARLEIRDPGPARGGLQGGIFVFR